MVTQVIVRGRGLDLAAMMTWEDKVTFALLRSIFQGPVRITHELPTDTWHVDLDSGEEIDKAK